MMHMSFPLPMYPMLTIGSTYGSVMKSTLIIIIGSYTG